MHPGPTGKPPWLWPATRNYRSAQRKDKMPPSQAGLLPAPRALPKTWLAPLRGKAYFWVLRLVGSRGTPGTPASGPCSRHCVSLRGLPKAHLCSPAPGARAQVLVGAPEA